MFMSYFRIGDFGTLEKYAGLASFIRGILHFAYFIVIEGI